MLRSFAFIARNEFAFLSFILINFEWDVFVGGFTKGCFVLFLFVLGPPLPMYNLIIIPLCMLVLQSVASPSVQCPYGLSLLQLQQIFLFFVIALQFLQFKFPRALRALDDHRLIGGFDDRGAILLRLVHVASVLLQRLQ